MSYLPSLPEANLLDVFQRWPELAKPFHLYMEQVMRGPSPLSEGERELLAAFVSRLNGCRFCELSHSKVAKHFGVHPGPIDELARNVDEAPIDDRLKALFHFVEKLTRTPAEMRKEDIDSVLEAGWDETAIYHATQVCGAFNNINRSVEALGIEADPGTAEMGALMLYERGYKGVTELLSTR